MVQYKICNTHHVLYDNKIIPIKKYRKRCMECLHINIEGYAKAFQIVTPEYNYLYPMICDNCSRKLNRCKWCRVMKTGIRTN